MSQQEKLAEIAFTLFWVPLFTFYSYFLVPVLLQREWGQESNK
jgi:hypothetical protein